MAQASRNIILTFRRLSSFKCLRQSSSSTIDNTLPLSACKTLVNFVLQAAQSSGMGLKRLAKDEGLDSSTGSAEGGLYQPFNHTLLGPQDSGIEQATAYSKGCRENGIVDHLTPVKHVDGMSRSEIVWMKVAVHRSRNESGWGRTFQDAWISWKYGSRHAKGTWQQNMAFSTSSRRLKPLPAAVSTSEPISTDQFHRLADEYIDNLVKQLEELQEERRDVDCEYSAGVLNLDFPPAGTYVLNKQPPNKQIWLSSPISGPKRYDYVLSSSRPQTDDALTGGDGASRDGTGIAGQGERGEWVYLRDGSTLSGLLREELGVEMEVGEISGDD
ncbi:MAG: hypothetical protein Q9182_004596 [Xanthomendoza sp. 2 TL-2023]